MNKDGNGSAVVSMVLSMCVFQAPVTHQLPQDKGVLPQDATGLATSEDLAMGLTTRQSLWSSVFKWFMKLNALQHIVLFLNLFHTPNLYTLFFISDTL